MKFLDKSGKIRNLKKPRTYIINWEKPSRSKFQTSVKNFLFPYWKHHVVFEEFRIVGSRLSLDFYNASKKIAIEVQGHQHIKFVKHFHRDRRQYLNQLKRDQTKLDFCERNDILLVEIYPEDKISEEFFKEKFNVYL